MKDGSTHLAHKAEHAVDLETGAVIAVTLQAADRGDTATLNETLSEAAGNVAHLVEREAGKAPAGKPRVSPEALTEIVADKGYHSSETVLAVQQSQARSYIPEPRRPRRKWAGKAAEQRAVYANRRRVKGSYSKRLMKKRGELIERSFAHCYETGDLRRVYLRGRENVWKRQLILVGAFNLSLVMRRILGAGTPRELRNRQRRAFLLVLVFSIPILGASQTVSDVPGSFHGRIDEVAPPHARKWHRRISEGSTTGCYATFTLRLRSDAQGPRGLVP